MAFISGKQQNKGQILRGTGDQRQFWETGKIWKQRGSYMVWEIKWEYFNNIMLSNCVGYAFYIYGAFEFLCNSIANL